MLAPDPETARSKLSTGSGRPRRSPRPGGTRARARPGTVARSRAGPESRRRRPGRARRASHAETYAVPQPSSTTSSPSTAPRRPEPALRDPEAPRSSRPPPSRARAGIGVLGIRLRPVLAVPLRVVRDPGHGVIREARIYCSPEGRRPPGESRDRAPPRATRRGRTATALALRSPSSPSRARCSPEQRCEVAPDRAWRRVRRIGRAHHSPNAEDRVLTAHGQREHRARGDEPDELSEERLSLVLGVVLLARAREIFIDGRRAARSRDARSGRRSRRTVRTNAVRLDENECGFGSHRRERVVAIPPGSAVEPPRRQLERRTRNGWSASRPRLRSAGRAWRSTGTPGRSARAETRTSRTPA